MTSLVPVAMPLFKEERGSLTAGQIGQELPFVPQRYFIIYDVPAGTTRGGHAHHSCDQFLIAVSGQIAVTLDDGQARTRHALDRPDCGLHIPAGIWAEEEYLTSDARLLVLASEPYDPNEYIDDRNEFLRVKGFRL